MKDQPAEKNFLRTLKARLAQKQTPSDKTTMMTQIDGRSIGQK
jgi:hypothetical protein